MEKTKAVAENNESLDSLQKKIEALPLETLIASHSGLPCKPYLEGDFTYIESEADLKEASALILQSHKMIGIDIEQTNTESYSGYNCLIQISATDKNYIIDAIALKNVLATYLKPICEAENIVKIFYSGSSDLQWLNRDYGISVINFFDVYHASLFVKKQKDLSLVGLLKEHCNYTVNKETKKQFQVSDWRQRPLTKDQLNYAMIDAHYLIYLRNILLEKMKQVKDQASIEDFLRRMQLACLKPFEVKSFNWNYYVENFHKQANIKKSVSKEAQNTPKLELIEVKQRFLSLCKLRDEFARQIDTNLDLICSLEFLFQFTLELPQIISSQEIENILKRLNETPKLFLENINKIEEALNSAIGREYLQKHATEKDPSKKAEGKSQRRQIHEKNFTLKNQLYENCRVLAPDNELLSYTNRKKVNWYLNRGFAELVSENPLTVRLKFEPSGRGTLELAELNLDKNEYMKHNRVNQCVVCGKQDHISRYHVVPSLYRQHFPSELKNHRAYDVLLMCWRCREKANFEADQFKAEIAKRYNVPLVEFNRPQQIIQVAKGIQRSLSTFLKCKADMPKDRRREIKNHVREAFLSIAEDPILSEETQKSFAQFEYKEKKVKLNEKFVSYFLQLKNFKYFAEKNSNKDFKNIHGKLVIEKMTFKDIKKFIEEWRTTFIHSMDPQFLPHDWNLALEQKAKIAFQENEKNQEI